MKNAPAPVRLTLKELVDHYEGFLREYEKRSAETHGTYQRALRTFLQWFPVDRKFLFRSRDVERYRRYLVERKELQSVSVGTYMTALRRFCQYLVDVGVLQENPAGSVVGGHRPQRHSRAYLTSDEVEVLLGTIDRDTLQGARDYAIVRLMLDCGLSERECLLADTGDIQEDAARGWIVRVQGKGRAVKDITMTIPMTAHEAIEEYLRRRFPEQEIPADAPMFASMSNRTAGDRMTARGMRSAVNRWLEESGVKGDRDRRLTPFSLRHTAGFQMVEEGASVDEVMTRMRIEWRPTAMLYFRERRRGSAGASGTSHESES